MNEQKCDIFEIFKSEPKEPFALNMQINKENASVKDIFEKVKELYCKGMIIQTGQKLKPNVNKIKINEITNKHLENMKGHMLSLGIDVKHTTYTRSEKDYIFRQLLYDIQGIDKIRIKVLLDWKEDLIEKIDVDFKINELNQKIILDFENTVRKHFEANHFLKFVKPKDLKEYAFIIKNNEVTHVIYFDFAKHIENLRAKLVKYTIVNK
tara:strand:- start:69 stop:695 length:627 start_codon:yes stop_codon:yes gene_type:complete